MTDSVVMIDEQPKKFWISSEERGWLPMVGHIVNVNGVQIGMFPTDGDGDREQPVLHFTELTSGTNIKCVPVHPEDVNRASTEEGYRKLVARIIANEIIPLFDYNSNTLDSQIEKKRKEVVAKLGKRPAIVDYIGEEE